MSSRPTGVNLTAAEREALQVEAYELSLQGKTYRDIADRIDVHFNTVPKLVKREALNRRSENSHTKQLAISRYVRLFSDCYEELQRPQSNGLARGHLYNACVAILTRIDKLNGDEAPTKANVTQRIEHVDYSALSEEQLEEVVDLEEQWKAILSGAIKGEG